MDIFELAQQGMQIQEEEIARLEAEELAAKTKNHKLNIFEIIEAAQNKDYDWFNRLGEDQKNFQPYILNMWLARLWPKNSPQKKFTNNDWVMADLVKSVNRNLNTNVFCPKGMFWLLACTIQEHDAPFTVDYKKSTRAEVIEKYNPKVIDYMAKELLSSKEKIGDMIISGLITDAMMQEIEKDLETIEEKKKK